MCVVSMIVDHQFDEWNRRYRKWIDQGQPPVGGGYQPPPAPMPSKEEIDEFHRLLERAREYDKRNNEPDCEMEEKRNKLLNLAKELGIEITFV